MLNFILPTEQNRDDVLTFYDEIEKSGGECIGMCNYKNYDLWLAGMRNRHMGKNLPEGYVRENFYLCYEEKRLMGVFSLKFRLTEFLLNYGGHIGYAVRPSCRNRGLATQMLKQGLDLAGVNVIQGDALNAEDVVKAMEGQEILLCSLEGDVLTMAKNIVAALEKTSVKRIIWITGMGIHHEITGVRGMMLNMYARQRPEYIKAADTIAACTAPEEKYMQTMTDSFRQYVSCFRAGENEEGGIIFAYGTNGPSDVKTMSALKDAYKAGTLC